MRPEAVVAEVQALQRLDLEGLRALWRSRWGAPSALRSPELLRHMIAWRLQAAAYGDLDPEVRRSLRRSRAPLRKGLTIPAGTRLAREWKGNVHEVAVTEEGFHYDGQTYRGLSKVAAVITGGKWNGPRFFGVSPPTEA